MGLVAGLVVVAAQSVPGALPVQLGAWVEGRRASTAVAEVELVETPSDRLGLEGLGLPV